MSQIQTRNPATGEVLETYEVMSEQEVFAKIDSAHEAFLDWRSKSHEERAPYLRKIAGVLRDNSERFSELMTREMGKLLRADPGLPRRFCGTASPALGTRS